MQNETAAAALAAIAAEVSQCKLCRLYEGTTHPVPGAGSPNAEILFIGEGPGFYEDKSGLPFVGRGPLLGRDMGRGASAGRRLFRYGDRHSEAARPSRGESSG